MANTRAALYIGATLFPVEKNTQERHQMTASREKIDYAIGDMFEELNDCKHHLQHNAKQVKANQYLTKRVADLEAELEQACAEALEPAAGGLRGEGPGTPEGQSGCDCPKCKPPDEARWRLGGRDAAEKAPANPYEAILDSVADMLGGAFELRDGRAGGGRLLPTGRTRRTGGPAGRAVERLWQSEDGTAGEWRREAPATVRVF
jgi:hypothetical protein